MRQVVLGVFGLGLCAAMASTGNASSESVLYSFCSKQNCTDGSHPSAGLVSVGSLLYGTTRYGGASDAGTIFSIDPTNGQFKTVYAFTGGPDGSHPISHMIYVKKKLYGTAYEGGTNGRGTVFSVNPKTGSMQTLHIFAGGQDGQHPVGDLAYLYGRLYGTTETGGGNGNCPQSCGTIYVVETNSGLEAVLVAFGGSQQHDGAYPQAGLTELDGVFYGTTSRGGEADVGTAFSYDLEQATYTKFDDFLGAPDSSQPFAGLTTPGLYGTTYYGGSGDCGTAFYTTTGFGHFILHSFACGFDSAHPQGPLLSIKKNLYGTATAGGGTGCGGNGCGTVFRLKAKNGAETILHAFGGAPDGSYPETNLVEVNGVLYGITLNGGTSDGCGAAGCGTIFAVNP
ncbi:MAG: hypothetical protein JO056_00750 [Alphaproteobacteria bacterium]|nr:hypothetical protein [Alphaproteobacteria bacterium]